MILNIYKEVAIKYHVEDLPGSLLPGTTISKVLKRLESGEMSISNIVQNYLTRRELWALLRYIKKETTFEDFLNAAKEEQAERRLRAKVQTLKEQNEQKLQDEKQRLKNEAVQVRLRNISRAKEKLSRLKQKYALDYFIEKSDYPRIMSLLRRVDKGMRLSEGDIIWLNTEGEEYFTQELREGFHRIEADFHANTFKKNKDPWSAINASSHYRKCREPENADSIINMIDVLKLKNIKLKSALYTTHGGVKRDLQKWSEALSFGEQAHKLTPKDFRPCTLLGAVNMEIGNHGVGQSWYEKAVERGYSEDSVDDELRAIFARAEKPQRKALRIHLLKIDSKRYRWVNKTFITTNTFITSQ